MQEIIVVLDKSGSMQAYHDDNVGGFNAFLKAQQEIGEANLTIIFFDDTFDVFYEGKLSEMKPLTSWPSGGMTALLDSMGKTFSHVSDRFSKESPEKVVMAILTDGQENASHEFTKEQINDLMKHHQEKYGWDVIFLAANQDAWAVGKRLGFYQNKTFNYNQSRTLDAFDVVSSTVKSFRAK